MEHIRNFVIIAHIDHGKSTLADRFLEITNTVPVRQMKPQYLDQLELERERGITIKMAPVRMEYSYQGRLYILNLIDTPGHSDFGYEVSRALAAVEGAILLVDATQGMQAQTLANYESAKKVGLTIIGVVNKIDVASSEQVEATVSELAHFLKISEAEILRVSGKTGIGVETLLGAVIEKTPPPAKRGIGLDGLSRALIFDSLYHDHKGIIAFVRVIDGSFSGSASAELLATETIFKIKEVGYFSPQLKVSEVVKPGEIGYLATGIKNQDQLKIGDTIVVGPHLPLADSKRYSFPGYREPKPVVFVSFYPEDTDEYDDLKQALGKLRLTDSALTFEPDASEVLGRGFKGGFLGRLHFEITAERLEREFQIVTTNSFPSVAYQIRDRADGAWRTITNPKDFPNDYAEAMEPMTRVEILTPLKFLSPVLQLKDIFRFSEIKTETLGAKMLITAKLPLADLIRDLDDKLKSVSEGFASLNYEVVGYERADVQKLEVLVAGNVVPGLTRILSKRDLDYEGRVTVERLKELLPHQQFSQALQAASAGRIIARETIPAMKKELGNFGKNGGDRTRKMKLWKKQDRGKERLKERGTQTQVKIPASIFKELLKK